MTCLYSFKPIILLRPGCSEGALAKLCWEGTFLCDAGIKMAKPSRPVLMRDPNLLHNLPFSACGLLTVKLLLLQFQLLPVSLQCQAPNHPYERFCSIIMYVCMDPLHGSHALHNKSCRKWLCAALYERWETSPEVPLPNQPAIANPLSLRFRL